MPRDREYFSEWDDWAENWIQPNDTYVDDFNGAPVEGDTSVADWLISDVFELDLATPGKGSSLPGYDVKYRDSYQMVQLSLAYHLKDNELYECYANEIGEIEYYKIGDSNGGSGDIDEIYRIPSIAKVKPVNHVMIIGYDPPPRREVGDEYNLFTFYNEFHKTYITLLFHSDIYTPIWTWRTSFHIFKSQCFEEPCNKFLKFITIH